MAKKAYVSKKEVGALTSRLDSINYDTQDNGEYLITMIAWGLSKENFQVKCRVEDFAGKEVEAKIEATAYGGLLRNKEVTKEDNVGCYLVNVKSKTKDLRLILFTDRDEVTFDVKSNLTKAVWKRRISLIGKVIISINPRRIVKAFSYIRKYGFAGLKGKIVDTAEDKISGMEQIYPDWFDDHKATGKELKEQMKHSFEYAPKISIIVPTYKTPLVYFRQMVDSVINQTYSNWELCIADGSQGDKELEAEIEKYHNNDSRIVYKILDSNLGIAGNTNAAMELATGDIIALLDHDDVIEANALFEAVKAFQEDGVDAVYTDEDKILGPSWVHTGPNFKPDFNIDLLRSYNYITHFFLVKKRIIDEVGGFSSKYDGAQDYDLILRCTEKARKVRHIPKVLYQWRMHENSTAANPDSKKYCHEAGKRAIEDHLARLGVDATVSLHKEFGQYRVKYPVKDNPLLSIIIPNKDHTDDLDKCIRSIEEKSTYKNFEIIVVENNSTEAETFEYYAKLEKEYANVKVIKWEREFNYSAINNYGVKEAKGEYVLLLNNDTELIEPDSIEDMLGICQRPEVGIVGAKLIYDDNTVQHAGVILGLGGIAGHAFPGLNRDDQGYMSRAALTCDYTAVTAACLMISKQIYEEVEGLEEGYAVAFNDVDFCMKVRKAGYLVVYDAFSQWYHYESKSRGFEDTPEKVARFNSEIDRFESRWKAELEAGDPYYNVNFPLDYNTYEIRLDF